MLGFGDGSAARLLGGTLGAGGLSILAARARRRWGGALGSDATFESRTPDGWRLRLDHYRPDGAPRFSEPVILCHGLGANGHTFDLGAELSLARHLARAGFDTFVPELRGREGSATAGCSADARQGFTFDHHASLDAPALLDAVLARSGAARAFWVGHSMGGMVGYVLAARRPHQLAGLATLGSPVHARAQPALVKLLALALAVQLDPLPQRLLAQASVTLGGRRGPPAPALTVVRGNMEPEALARLLTNGVADVPRALVRQLLRWADGDRVDSEDGRADYLDCIGRVAVPLLVLGACADRLAPPEGVRPAFELARSTDRTFTCIGENDPTGRRFGHVDVLLGRHAPEVTFPLVERWLSERGSRLARPGRLAGRDPMRAHQPVGEECAGQSRLRRGDLTSPTAATAAPLQPA
jgi:pimeloyl-ACP methyl ester carboxylesterase